MSLCKKQIGQAGSRVVSFDLLEPCESQRIRMTLDVVCCLLMMKMKPRCDPGKIASRVYDRVAGVQP